MKYTLFAVLGAMLSQTAMAVDSRDVNTAINISYGVVASVQTQKVDSNAPRGAVVGGILGAVAGGHHDRGKHAVVGALAGGVLSTALQGDRTAYSYTVQLVSGGETVILTEQGNAQVGDCVAVEQGRSANIRRVPSAYCEHHDHPASDDYVVKARANENAADCHAAKDQAMQADTEEKVDIAMKKVSMFCD